MIIYGAGLAGLLTANILRRYQPVVHEAQSELPNNHEALLRFRTDAVSRATGIPFREVEVWKSIRYKGRTLGRPDIQMNNLYSLKVTGEYHTRSIGNLSECKRYIAPPDFIAQLARGLDIKYNSPLTKDVLNGRYRDADKFLTGFTPMISTVPLPAIVSMLELAPIVFNFKAITSVWFTIERPAMDVYQTIYYPDPDLPYYRASITGNRMIVEFMGPGVSELEADAAVKQILPDFGIVKAQLSCSKHQIKAQKYGKLLPINEQARRKAIVALTDKYMVYSVGRFATWRQILMDDVVQDVARVEGWIADRDDVYKRRLQQ